jgi:peroxiredoxin
MKEGWTELSQNLPVPVDDGAGDRLLGKNLPNIILASTSGKQINLADIQGKIVLYCYPMTGKPEVKRKRWKYFGCQLILRN